MKFLSLDSPLMKFLNRMTDVLWLNILTIVCSLPIVTIGASFTALHYVCLKMVRDEEGYITKDFFKSFKKNFKQATIIWVIVLLLTLLIYADYKCLQYVENPTFMFAAITAAAIFMLCTVLYVFPVLSHFENTVKGTIKNSFFMSILALPRTILMVLLLVSPLVILYCVEYFETATWLIPLVALFWFSAPAYYMAKLYNKTFKRFEPETASTNDDFSWTVGGEAETAVTEDAVVEEFEDSNKTEE